MELGGGRGRSGRLVARVRAPSLLCVSFCCCCFFACALFADAGRTPAHSATGISFGRGKSSPVQSVTAAAEMLWRRRTTAAAAATATAATRRYLVGPGSYPPRCASKCGDCIPCKPVHVPVPPGTPVITEYYPEAWRCKCGGKLYMP